MPECEFSGLPEQTCGHCLQVPVEKPGHRHTYFTATTTSVCDACGERILPGDRYRAWKRGGYKHAGCAPVRSPS